MAWGKSPHIWGLSSHTCEWQRQLCPALGFPDTESQEVQMMMLKHLLFPLMCHLLHVISPGSPAKNNPFPLWVPGTSTLWALTKLCLASAGPTTWAQRWHTQALIATYAALQHLPINGQHEPRASPEPEAPVVTILVNSEIGVLQVKSLNVKQNKRESRHSQELHNRGVTDGHKYFLNHLLMYL